MGSCPKAIAKLGIYSGLCKFFRAFFLFFLSALLPRSDLGLLMAGVCCCIAVRCRSVLLLCGFMVEGGGGI